MEPIQDDIEAVKRYIHALPDDAVWAALDRLVAERDRWKQKWVEDTTALEEERDALQADLLTAKSQMHGRITSENERDRAEVERDRLREKLTRHHAVGTPAVTVADWGKQCPICTKVNEEVIANRPTDRRPTS